MESKSTGRKLPLNFFDIIIIVLIIAVAGAFVYLQTRDSGSSDSGTSGTVEYTIELSRISQSTEGMIKPGDQIEDKIKKYSMGTVKSVDYYPATKDATDYTTGNTVYTEVPGVISAAVTLTAPCKYTDSDVTLDGGYSVKVGTEVSALGPGYSGGGYVIGVVRGDN